MENATTPNPLVARVARLFNEQLALENDYLRQENRILHGKLGKRVPLTDSERRILIKYGLRIKDRLGDVMSIVAPDTLLRNGRTTTHRRGRGVRRRAKRPRPSSFDWQRRTRGDAAG